MWYTPLVGTGYVEGKGTGVNIGRGIFANKLLFRYLAVFDRQMSRYNIGSSGMLLQRRPLINLIS